MAGDWIKMRSDLRDDPAVFKIAMLTKLDRFNVVGRLAAFWGWTDKHAVDGRVDGATVEVVDDVVAFPGFADALKAAGWLRVDASSVYIPNHERHNIESGKERSLKNARQAKWRAKKALEAAQFVDGFVDGDVDASSSTKTSTREEKRREESSSLRSEESAGKPASRSKGLKTTLKTYLENCKQAGQKPLPAGHPIRDYCRDAKISEEMLQVAWCVFRDDYTLTTTKKNKKYVDWPGHFANAVREGWGRIWYTDGAGSVVWSSRGLQEKGVLDARAKAREAGNDAA